MSKEAVRLWELGELDTEGENRARYLELLAQWQSGPQEPTQEPAEPEPEPGPEPEPEWQPGPLTNAGHKQSLADAIWAHQARMARIHGRA